MTGSVKDTKLKYSLIKFNEAGIDTETLDAFPAEFRAKMYFNLLILNRKLNCPLH